MVRKGREVKGVELPKKTAGLVVHLPANIFELVEVLPCIPLASGVEDGWF
jgi:hypothetical protein